MIILAGLLTISIFLNIVTLLGTVGLVDDNNRLDDLTMGLIIDNDRLIIENEHLKSKCKHIQKEQS